MRDDRVYLVHILESINKIRQYTVGGEYEFYNNSIIQDAVIRNLEIIGEATKNLSKELVLSTPDVPWRQMARFRDVLIHRYFGIELEMVWSVISQELPKVCLQVSHILSRY